MEETVLDWTFPNWITVCLMAALMFALVGVGMKALAKAKGAKDDA